MPFNQYTVEKKTITLSVNDHELLRRMLDGLRDEQTERLNSMRAPSKEDVEMYEFLLRLTAAVKIS